MKALSKSLGLLASIYKHENKSYDGIANFSQKVDQVIIVPSPDFPSIPTIFQPSPNSPPVAIVKRLVFNSNYLTAYPLLEDGTLDINC